MPSSYSFAEALRFLPLRIPSLPQYNWSEWNFICSTGSILFEKNINNNFSSRNIFFIQYKTFSMESSSKCNTIIQHQLLYRSAAEVNDLLLHTIPPLFFVIYFYFKKLSWKRLFCSVLTFCCFIKTEHSFVSVFRKLQPRTLCFCSTLSAMEIWM